MAAIAGIAKPDAEERVNAMLEQMAYRGPTGRKVLSRQGVTMGVCWPAGQPDAQKALEKSGVVEDAVSDNQYARAQVADHSFVLTRDPLGAAPLYYGLTEDGTLCFASEVKGLLDLVREVKELPPGSQWKAGRLGERETLKTAEPLEEDPLVVASELRRRIKKSVESLANRGVPFGVWLSGGLDSSIMVALACPLADTLHTFSAGFENSEDLEHARLVARHCETKHHEYSPTLKEITQVLPDVIYHLESFDDQVVRSSLMNYFVARMTADYVPAVFSGEGSDELFGGDEDLKTLPPEDLGDELIRRANQLHNTTLQRVDRCAGAFGVVPYLAFLDQAVIDYALAIPADYKIRNGLEKWILRRAVYDLLPERVLQRRKARFWEGAGMYTQMARYADEKITDADFREKRTLPDGRQLESKEELLYYLIFEEHFGRLEAPAWVGFV